MYRSWKLTLTKAYHGLRRPLGMIETQMTRMEWMKRILINLKVTYIKALF